MRLPKQWPRQVRSAVVHAVSMARAAFTVGQAHVEHHGNRRARLRSRNDQLEQQVALMQEELRIKDARMEQLPAQRRPHYPPVERLAILEVPMPSYNCPSRSTASRSSWPTSCDG